jgi:DNA-binding transcriptional ArsR family regulator
MRLDHPHPVDAPAVTRARRTSLPVPEAERLARLMGLLNDPTRLRILFALVGVEELCVGDVAEALDISADQSSYALKQLRQERLVQTRRDGRMMFYRLADEFPHPLLEHCLRQLLQIADGGR